MYLYAAPISVLFNQLLVTSNIASYSGALTYLPSNADIPLNSGLVSTSTFLNLFGSLNICSASSIVLASPDFTKSSAPLNIFLLGPELNALFKSSIYFKPKASLACLLVVAWNVYVGSLTTPNSSLCHGSAILFVKISGLKDTASISAFVAAFSVTDWTPFLKLALITSSTSSPCFCIKSSSCLLITSLKASSFTGINLPLLGPAVK